MKTKFLTIKKKSILAILLCVLCIGAFCTTFFTVRASASPKSNFCIVIDAGHGGIDGGCVGKTTGAIESELNLYYAQELEKLCKDFGMNVVMTRSTMEGLYSPFAKNKKRSEMEKREKIIKESGADLFVSIHMNSLSSQSAKGAQVFYKMDSESGKQFADDITQSLKEALGSVRGGSKEGDYYVLNCNDKAAVLVECGFLSNPTEEKLLITENYRKEFCMALFLGILNFLKM